MTLKKDKAEKRKTRREAKARYRARKAESGLMQITLWMPKEEAEAIAGRQKVGIVVASEDYAPGWIGVLECYDQYKLRPLNISIQTKLPGI